MKGINEFGIGETVETPEGMGTIIAIKIDRTGIIFYTCSLAENRHMYKPVRELFPANCFTAEFTEMQLSRI